jgi:DNA-binding NarL/FixJ family response regulator
MAYSFGKPIDSIVLKASQIIPVLVRQIKSRWKLQLQLWGFMMLKSTLQNENSMPKAQIHIGGEPKLQNKLLATYIEEKTGLTCFLSNDISGLPVTDSLKESQKSVFLWDCLDTDPKRLWEYLEECSEPSRLKCNVVLFNVKPNCGIENEAIRYNVQGIFYNNDPPEILVKGIKAILRGELWFSRQILTECLFGQKVSAGAPRKIRTSLTRREKEILSMIASGTSNDQIADTLCISFHTVKTHLYNIYKKVQVSNRTQAALWAGQHL